MEDIDIFANIDNYLNGDPETPSSPFQPLAPATAQAQLQLSAFSSPDLPTPPNRRTTKPTKSKLTAATTTPNKRKTTKSAAAAALLAFDDDDLDVSLATSDASNTSSGSSDQFVPGKGQKTAVKQFERIKASLKRHTQLTAPLHSPVPESAAAKRRAAAKPPSNIVAPIFTAASRRRQQQLMQQALAASSTDDDRSVVDLTGDIHLVGVQVPLFAAETGAGARSAQQQSDDVVDVFEAENCIVQVKVKWGVLPLQSMPLRRHHPFAELCQALGERYACDAEQIVLLMGDQIVQHEDTPDAIGYTIGKIITARSVESKKNSVAGRAPKTGTTGSSSSSNSTSTIELKIQSSLWKRPLMMSMDPTKRMMVLVIKCAQHLNCKPERLRLRFDGDALDLHATAAELDFEGGEVIDLWKTDD